MASTIGLLNPKQGTCLRRAFWSHRSKFFILLTSVRANHYDILGMDRTATTKEIRAAFLKKSKEHHPDIKNRKSDHENFVKVNEAYSVLSKRTSRRDYDLQIAGLRPSATHTSATPQSSYGQQRQSNQYQNVFYDEQVLKMRSRIRNDQFKERTIFGLSVISNAGIVIGCMLFMITGIILHSVVVKKSSDTLSKNLSDRDVKIHTMWTDAVNEAKQYSKEEHLERLKDYQETVKWRKQN